MKLRAINSDTAQIIENVFDLENEVKAHCLIGRSDDCDLALDSPYVSRFHAMIAWQKRNFYLTDLGSTGGTQINNEILQVNRAYPLKSDDIIRIGEYIILFNDLELEQLKNIGNDVAQKSTSSVVAPIEWKKETMARCVEVIPETEDVKTFRFVAETPMLFSYKPGQFITFYLDIDGQPKTVVRCYSISSSPSRPHVLEVTVKRVPSPTDIPDAPPGLVSNWLHDNMKVGTIVKIGAPAGHFTCVDHPSQKVLFISAGSGITPMMSMSRWLCDKVENTDIIFLHSARSPRDIIFRQELELMAARHPNFKLAVTLTRPHQGESWMGYRGRLSENLLSVIAPDYQERTVYVCGPEPFMIGVKKMLGELNFPMENYFEESFGSAPKKKPAQPKTQPTPHTPKTDALAAHPPAETAPASNSGKPLVVLTKSGLEIPCDSEEAILDIVEAEGVDLPCGCRMGSCGACKLPLLEGNVVYDNDPNCESGFLLTCIGRANGRVVIEA